MRVLALFGPACAAALLAGACACLLLPDLPSWAWLALALLIGFWFWLRSDALRLPGLLLVGFGLSGLHAANALQAQLPLELEQKVVGLKGRIIGLPEMEARRTRFRIQVIEGPHSLRKKTVQLAWYDDYGSNTPGPRVHLHAGATWYFQAKLRAPRGLRNPSGFDSERHALVNRIAAMGQVRNVDTAVQMQPPSGIDAWRERMSLRIAAAGHQKELRFVRALALGDTVGLDDADWATLRADGLTHLIAISGFHVGLVAGFFALLCRALWWIWPELGRRLPRPLAAGIAAVLGAWVYTMVVGFALPTMRTSLMITILVAARLWRRNAATGDALALAMIILIVIDPLALLSPGFWLSFIGVAWLLWCMPQGNSPHVRQFFGAQAVATLGLLPFTILWFGQASLAGPLANLIAVPWWSLVVVPLSLLGTALDTVYMGAGDGLWRCAAVAFSWTWPGFEWLGRTTLALWSPAQAHWLAVPLSLIGTFWLLLPRGTPGKTLAALLWLPLVYPEKDLPAAGQAEIVLVDVGQGLSVVVRTQHHVLLYDMGPAIENGFDAGERAVVPTLHALGVDRIDAAIVSHGDNDHAGGLQAVRDRFALPSIYSPNGSEVPATQPCVAGTQWQWDGVHFGILHPPSLFPYLDNESSCILRIQTVNGVALLLGDVGEVIERRLLREQPRAIRSDVVIVAHHGSGGSSDPAFVRATNAALALLSTGDGNRFQHPHPAVVARWRDAGALVEDTARDGALRVRLGDKQIALRSERSGHVRLWDAERRRRRAAGLSYRPN